MMPRFPVLTMLFLLGLSTCADAITVLPLSERDLTKRATVIVIGEVEDVSSEFNRDGGTIHTFARIRVTRSLKGEISGDHITLRQVGGTVGDQTIVLPGGPSYAIGEEILVFAGPFAQSDAYGVLGIFYGKYDIETDTHTGRKTVNGPSFATTHYDPDTLLELPRRERPDKVELDDFIAEIESYLREQ